MTWVLFVLAVLVVGGCVVLAAGRGGQLGDVYDDRPDVMLPGDRPLGGDDLRAVRFTTALRGYRMGEVDALLARLAVELDVDGRTGPAHAAPAPDGDDVTGLVRRDEAGGRAG